MNKEPTLDQKLKAFEIAVAIFGPVRKLGDKEDPKVAAEVMHMAVSQYEQIATTILALAQKMKVSLD